MEQSKLDDAAKAAAKILFGDECESGELAQFVGTLDFDVSFLRGKAHERSNPQKARPWSLVQVLVSKLNATIGEAAVEEWLAEGIKEAQLLDKDEETAAKKRVEGAIAKLLPHTKEFRPGNLACKGAEGSVTVKVRGKRAAVA